MFNQNNVYPQRQVLPRAETINKNKPENIGLGVKTTVFFAQKRNGISVSKRQLFPMSHSQP